MYSSAFNPKKSRKTTMPLTRSDLICAVGRARIRMNSKMTLLKCPHIEEWDIETAWTAYQVLGAI